MQRRNNADNTDNTNKIEIIKEDHGTEKVIIAGVVGLLRKDANDKYNELNKSLEHAFAGSKGSHKSQWFYKAIWKAVKQNIFDKIACQSDKDRAILTEEQIEEEFNQLFYKEDDQIDLEKVKRFLNDNNDIIEKYKSMDRYWAALTSRKQNILLSLIKAFKALALQYLKLSSSPLAKIEEKACNIAKQYVKAIDKRIAQYSARFENGNVVKQNEGTTDLDQFQALAKDEALLIDDLKKTTWETVTKIVEAPYAGLQTKRDDYFTLQEKYQKQYGALKNSIESGELPDKVISELLDDLERQYLQISQNRPKKQELIDEIQAEIKAVPKREISLPKESVKTTFDTQYHGLLNDLNNIECQLKKKTNEAIDELSKLSKTCTLERQKDEIDEYYSACKNVGKETVETLSKLCRDQHYFKNPLWEDAIAKIKEAFQFQCGSDLSNAIIQETNNYIADIKQTVEEKFKTFQKDWGGKIDAAKALLIREAKEFAQLSEKLFQEEIVNPIKKSYLDKLDLELQLIEKSEVDSRPISSPAELKELFNAKKQDRENLAIQQKNAQQAEEKAKRKAEAERHKAEVKQQQEEKKKLEEQQEEEKTLKKNYPSYIDAKTAIQNSVSNLDSFFAQTGTQDMFEYSYYQNIKKKYEKASDDDVNIYYQYVQKFNKLENKIKDKYPSYPKVQPAEEVVQKPVFHGPSTFKTRAGTAQHATPQKPGFWRRFGKAIAASTVSGAISGLAAGSALGGVAGLIAAVPTFGLSVPILPLVFGAVGAAIGAVSGFVTGLVSSVVAHRHSKKRSKLKEIVVQPDPVENHDVEQNKVRKSTPALSVVKRAPEQQGFLATHNLFAPMVISEDQVMGRVRAFETDLAWAVLEKLHPGEETMQEQAFRVNKKALCNIIENNTGGHTGKKGKKLSRECAAVLLIGKYTDLKPEHFTGNFEYLREYVSEQPASRQSMSAP